MSNPYLLFLTKDEVTSVISQRLSDIATQFSQYPDRIEFIDIADLLEELDESATKIIEIKTVLEQIKQRG